MRLHQWQVWGWRRMHLPILALFFFVKAFSKYFSCLFLFLMHVPQKKGMNQTSPVSASKAQDNLRQHQLSSLLSNTLSGQPWSFWNHSVVSFFCFFFCSNRFFFTVSDLHCWLVLIEVIGILFLGDCKHSFSVFSVCFLKRWIWSVEN